MKNQQIEKLTQMLLACGYHSEQIRLIITETLDSLPAEGSHSREQSVIEALEGYVEFATKCKMTSNKAVQY